MDTQRSSFTAVVTGATSGIGQQVALQLAERGWRVIAIGRDQEALAELGRSSALITPRAADLLTDDLAALLPARVDALVHAAGISPDGGVERTDAEDWSRVFALNVTAGAQVVRYALPSLRRSRGTIVFVNSGAGTAARPRNTPYAASKHALRALANGLRGEEEAHGVRVSTVYPDVHRGRGPQRPDPTLLRGCGYPHRDHRERGCAAHRHPCPAASRAVLVS